MSNLIEVGVQTYNKTNVQAFLQSLPNDCPHCFQKIEPRAVWGYKYGNKLAILLACMDLDCNGCFIAIYKEENNNQYSFERISNYNTRTVKFEKIIEEISPSFVKIYQEAYVAEQQSLFEICGVGYRKALEFLIKDYLSLKKPEKAGDIAKMNLSTCIEKFVSNENIKQTAKRAVWLGNDETHFARMWHDKDLNDLKLLVKITIHWMEMEELTLKFIEEMNPGND